MLPFITRWVIEEKGEKGEERGKGGKGGRERRGEERKRQGKSSREKGYLKEFEDVREVKIGNVIWNERWKGG